MQKKVIINYRNKDGQIDQIFPVTTWDSILDRPNIDFKVINNLVAETTGNALDANQGRLLNEAINNLNATLSSSISTIANARPINHATSSTTYGVASSTNYGHVRVIDSLGNTSSTDALSAYQGYTLNSSINSVANARPINHASSATTYGAASSANYGHVRVFDSLSNISTVDALSANQGYQLNNSISNLNSTLTSSINSVANARPINHASSSTTYGAASSTNYGHVRVIDNLGSYSSTDALSAYQGNALNQNKAQWSAWVSGVLLPSGISSSSDSNALYFNRCIIGGAIVIIWRVDGITASRTYNLSNLITSQSTSRYPSVICLNGIRQTGSYGSDNWGSHIDGTTLVVNDSISGTQAHWGIIVSM